MAMTELRDELHNTQLPAQPTDAKAFVEGFLIRMCDVMAIDKRGPDVWEVNQVLAAIGALDVGWFNLACVYTEKAMAPPGERAEQWRNPVSGVTRQQLEQVVGDCRHRPVRVPGQN